MSTKTLLFILSLCLGLSTYASDQISGHWAGVNYTSQVKGPSKVLVNFTQKGKTITGNYWAATGVAGTGVGMMTSPTTFTMEWVNITTNCPGTYGNHYTIHDDKITWKFTGKDCLGLEEGHGYASK